MDAQEAGRPAGADIPSGYKPPFSVSAASVLQGPFSAATKPLLLIKG